MPTRPACRWAGWIIAAAAWLGDSVAWSQGAGYGPAGSVPPQAVIVSPAGPHGRARVLVAQAPPACARLAPPGHPLYRPPQSAASSQTMPAAVMPAPMASAGMASRRMAQAAPVPASAPPPGAVQPWWSAPLDGPADDWRPCDEAACRWPRPCWLGCSETCGGFERFISPTSNPIYFEDPRTLSEVRAIFVEQGVPQGNALLGGGDLQAYLLQFRAALGPRLSLIGTKSGWLNLNSPAAGDRDGFADLAAGLKYNLVSCPAAQYLLSGGFTYESTVGQSEVFQGSGDGEFYFFASQGWELAPCLHWLSCMGWRLPTDHTVRSQMWHWSNHWDYELVPNLYAFFELDWFTWIRSGRRTVADFEGLDLFNFGSTDVGGNDIITATVGPTLKPRPGVEISGGYEFPLTRRRDILEHRAYAHLILRF